jgi:transcription initiation factor TFIIIB Brf1 subunit/transcription initiation factor TFIIB
MKKVYVDDSNQAEIICSNCGFIKKIDATDFKNTQKKFKAKCKCGEIIRFNLDYRDKYRKVVALPGEYSIQGKKVEIIIRDLSMSGIQFESQMPPSISVGDILEVIAILKNMFRNKKCMGPDFQHI